MKKFDNSIDLVCIISDLGGGGTQRVLHHLVGSWVSQGRRIAVITYADEEMDRYKLPSEVKRFVIGGISESKNSIFGLIANINRIIKLRKVLKKINSPVILSFLSTVNIATVLASIGIPARVIISERNDPARQSFGKIWDWLRYRFYRYADIVTANSQGALKTLTEFVPEKKCRLVNNPIFPELITKKNNKNTYSILSVGRLHHQKAYDILLQAFSKFSQNHPDWELLVLGDGSLKTELQRQARELKVDDRIKWKGYVVDPFPYYHAADIFVMPSRYEGMPNALLEAMNCGLPVIVSDASPGPLEIVENNKNGVVVPVEDTEALAEALNTLAKDKKLRKNLSYNAKKSVKPYHIDQVISQWDFLFK